MRQDKLGENTGINRQMIDRIEAGKVIPSIPINDGIIKRLESKFIIARTTNTVLSDFIEPKFPYTLNPWISETLNSNSDIIEFDENQLRTNEIVLKEYIECLSAQGVFNF